MIRLAAVKGSEGASHKAFFNRWPTKNEFLPDAVVYALLREHEADDPQEYIDQVPDVAHQLASFSEAVIDITDGLLAALLRHPRSYLVLHLGPLLPHHPELWKALLPEIRGAIQAWAAGYTQLVDGLGLVLRPEWSVERVSLVLQAMLDGFVLRYRVQPDDYPTSHYEGISIFADAVIAFILGIMDWEKTGVAGRVVLDGLVERVGSEDAKVNDSGS